MLDTEGVDPGVDLGEIVAATLSAATASDRNPQPIVHRRFWEP